MKICYVVICFFICSLAYGQATIRGTVKDSKQIPLEGAAVYLNNTTIGTTTDEKGQFELEVPKGAYKLIVSYLGYTTISFSLNKESYTKPLAFQLKEKNNVLSEILIPKKLRRSKRRQFLKEFRRNFLGESSFGKKAKIFNEKDLKFSFDDKAQKLTAIALKPLRIVNNSLGYKLTYDLQKFEIVNSKVRYYGYVRFEEMNSSLDQTSDWIRNRNERFYGSSSHFYRALINDTMEDEKFIVDNVQLLRNPRYPKEEDILKSKRILDKNGRKSKFQKTHYHSSITSQEEIQKALKVMKRARYPKFISKKVKTKLDPFDYSEYDGTKHFLEFSDYLKITYYGYYPDINYKKRHNKNFKYQVSLIKLKKDRAILQNPGELTNPLDVYTEGYWAFKRVADLLPLNYIPR